MIPDFISANEYDQEDCIIYDLLPEEQLIRLEKIRLVLCSQMEEEIPWYATICGCIDMAYDFIFNEESDEICH